MPALENQRVLTLRRKPAKRGDIWHLDEVRIIVGGKLHWLWRTVNQVGYFGQDPAETTAHKSRQTAADPASASAGHPAQTHAHRQASLLLRGPAQTAIIS